MSLAAQRRSRRLEAKIDFTPLIDCAFTLIIFFAVSTTLITSRAGIDVNLPGAATAEVKTRNVQISIRDDLKIYFEDVPVADSALVMMVQKRLEEDAESSFIINADNTVPYETLVHVLDKVRSAGATRIALAAEQQAEETDETKPNETEEENQ